MIHCELIDMPGTGAASINKKESLRNTTQTQTQTPI